MTNYNCQITFGRSFAAVKKINLRRKSKVMNIWIIFIGFMILSWIVSMVLKSKFKKYSKILVDNGMSGRDVAERMLRDHGITDVKVESVKGQPRRYCPLRINNHFQFYYTAG
jgi:hypothetical protein